MKNKLFLLGLLSIFSVALQGIVALPVVVLDQNMRDAIEGGIDTAQGFSTQIRAYIDEENPDHNLFDDLRTIQLLLNGLRGQAWDNLHGDDPINDQNDVALLSNFVGIYGENHQEWSSLLFAAGIIH